MYKKWNKSFLKKNVQIIEKFYKNEQSNKQRKKIHLDQNIFFSVPFIFWNSLFPASNWIFAWKSKQINK